MKKEIRKYMLKQNQSANILEKKGYRLQGLDCNNNICVIDPSGKIICNKDYESILKGVNKNV